MPIVNPLIKVPPRIDFLIKHGGYTREGSVVRDTAGQIAAHLDETTLAEEAIKAVISAGNTLTQHKGMTVTGLITVAAVGAGGVMLHRLNKETLKIKDTFEDQANSDDVAATAEEPVSDISRPNLRAV